MLARMVIRVLLVAVVAMTLAGCGGDDGAAETVKDLVMESSSSNYAEAWERLHPAQQPVVPKDLFVRCGVESEAKRDPKVDNVEILESEKVTKDIPWVGEVEATEVKFRMTQGDTSREAFYDMVEVDGDWRWTLSDRSLAAFEAGTCPS